MSIPWARSDMIYWNPAVQIRDCDHQLELERDRTCIQQTSSIISHGSVRSSSGDTVSTEHFGENVVAPIPTVFYHNMWSTPLINKWWSKNAERCARRRHQTARKARANRYKSAGTHVSNPEILLAEIWITHTQRDTRARGYHSCSLFAISWAPLLRRNCWLTSLDTFICYTIYRPICLPCLFLYTLVKYMVAYSKEYNAINHIGPW